MLSSGWAETRLVEYWPSMLGVLYWTPAPHDPGTATDAYHLGSQEIEAGASRAQIHAQLHKDFKISLGYWRPYLKTKTKKLQN